MQGIQVDMTNILGSTHVTISWVPGNTAVKVIKTAGFDGWDLYTIGGGRRLARFAACGDAVLAAEELLVLGSYSNRNAID